MFWLFCFCLVVIQNYMLFLFGFPIPQGSIFFCFVESVFRRFFDDPRRKPPMVLGDVLCCMPSNRTLA